jgi:hypothetical protein
MATKQILNSSTSPDGSQYVTLTDGAGNLVTAGGGGSSGITIGTTTITGGATTQVLFNLAGVVSSDTGLTYAGSGGQLNLNGGANAANTALVVNPASLTTGLVADFQLAGVSQVNIDKNGNLNARSGLNIIGGTVAINSTSWNFASNTANIKLGNPQNTGIGWNAANVVEINTGTRGTFASLKLLNLVSTGVITPATFTVATLPVAPATGSHAVITDQLTTSAAKGIAPTGGGAVVCTVMYNGAGWVGI